MEYTIKNVKEGDLVKSKEYPGFAVVKKSNDAPYKLYYAWIDGDLPEGYNKNDAICVSDFDDDHLG